MKKHKTILPPAFAQKILLRFLRDDLAEEVLGDLEEKFYTNVKTKSLFKAKMNYWYQVLHYLRPFAIRKSQPAHIISCAMYKSYFKIGWRNLLKNKTYSLINIGGLAFGLAVALLIALWVYDEMSFNKYHKNYETIAKVYRTNDWGEGIETSTSVVVGLGTLLRTEYGSHFKNVVMVRQRVEERIIGFGENKMTQGGYFMQPEGIAMFSLKMLHSSGKEPLRDMMSIVIAESLAKKLFGNIDVINKIVSMDGISDLTVTGVFEDLPRNSEFHGAMFFAPLDLFVGGPNKLNAWDNYNMTIYVQLHMSGQLATVSTAIQNAILPHVDQETADTKPQLFLHPMSDWHLKAHFENGVTVTSEQMRLVWSYCTIGVFVLILACINFMNLSTARSIKRAREVGIRKSIGSLRSQLIQQFFGESLLVSFLSLLAALMMAKFVLPWFNFISDKDLSIPWTTSTFWIAAISFTIITGLFAGSYPALYLSSFNPVKVLKGTFKAGKAASVPRSILVILQFTVSLCLIIGTIIVYQQIQFVKDRPIGYTREGLLSFNPRSPEFRGKYQVLRNELKKTGAVEEIAEANYAITSTRGWNGGFYWKEKKYKPSFNTIFVTHEYGKTIGWEIMRGRDFSREVSSDTAGIIINESALRVLGLANPIDEFLSWRPGRDGVDLGTFKILGVVKDMVKGSPFEPTDPSIIFLSRNDLSNLYVRINPLVSVHEALPKIQKVFNQIIPSAPFEYTFADEDYEAKFQAEERIGQIAALFSLLTIFISCLGLFGLAAFVAEQRTKEIGIRKVMGASVLNVWRMLSKDFVLLVIIASIVAIPIAFYFMSNWLSSYVYRIEISGWIFLWAGIGALVITLLTVSYQAIKAAMMNPVKSLRSE